jgi:hypothetical protein
MLSQQHNIRVDKANLPYSLLNLVPAMHHMVVARQAWVTGLTGTIFFSFVLEV